MHKCNCVFPTHVGVNRGDDISEEQEGSIPHTRGGEPLGGLSEEQKNKYSPHTWG